jgi:hypothetical protein
MTTHLASSRRPVRGLATLVAATALLVVACGSATPSPSSPTSGSGAPAASPAAPAGSAGSGRATPAASASILSLRVAPGAPCQPGGTGDSCIAPGRYELDAGLVPGTATIDVPAGWFEWEPGGGSEGLLVDGGTDAPNGSGWGLLIMSIGRVSLDPCDSAKGSLRGTPTVDEMLLTMASWPGFKATAPTSVTVGGMPGQLIQLTYVGKPSSCIAPAVWTTSSATPIDGYPMVATPSRPAKFVIMNVKGTLLAIRITDYLEPSPFEIEQGVAQNPTRHKADQPKLQAMLDSIRFTQ